MSAPTNRNQCGVLTLYPMTVNCSVTNPSSTTSQNGVASLVIGGGTPPYTIVWANGLGSNQTLTNLGGGTYSATVTDSTQDYTITTNCVLVPPTTTTTSTTTTTTKPPCDDICLTFQPMQVKSLYE